MLENLPVLPDLVLRRNSASNRPHSLSHLPLLGATDAQQLRLVPGVQPPHEVDAWGCTHLECVGAVQISTDGVLDLLRVAVESFSPHRVAPQPCTQRVSHRMVHPTHASTAGSVHSVMSACARNVQLPLLDGAKPEVLCERVCQLTQLQVLHAHPHTPVQTNPMQRDRSAQLPCQELPPHAV